MQSAKHWLPTYRGKRIIIGYKRWYGVDQISAIIELRMLGVTIPESAMAAALATREANRLRNAQRKERLARRNAYEEESFAIDEFPDMERSWASNDEWPGMGDATGGATTRADDEIPF